MQWSTSFYPEKRYTILYSNVQKTRCTLQLFVQTRSHRINDIKWNVFAEASIKSLNKNQTQIKPYFLLVKVYNAFGRGFSFRIFASLFVFHFVFFIWNSQRVCQWNCCDDMNQPLQIDSFDEWILPTTNIQTENGFNWSVNILWNHVFCFQFGDKDVHFLWQINKFNPIEVTMCVLWQMNQFRFLLIVT